MRVVRLGIADAVDDRHLALVPERLDRGHAGVEAVVIVDGQDLILGDTDRRTLVVVERVAVGDDRVQGIVAAGELQHHQRGWFAGHASS